MYMWDSRNVWGIGYPNRPSFIWITLGLLNLSIAACSLVEDAALRLRVYTWLTLLSGLLTLILGLIAYYQIEAKKLLAFNIDEIGLQINHYFKRKQAIFSPLGFTVLVISILRFIIVCFIPYHEM